MTDTNHHHDEYMSGFLAGLRKAAKAPPASLADASRDAWLKGHDEGLFQMTAPDTLLALASVATELSELLLTATALSEQLLAATRSQVRA